MFPLIRHPQDGYWHPSEAAAAPEYEPYPEDPPSITCGSQYAEPDGIGVLVGYGVIVGYGVLVGMDVRVGVMVTVGVKVGVGVNVSVAVGVYDNIICTVAVAS